ILPGGHYGRSIAASNSQLLVLARDEGSGKGIIDTVSLLNYSATALTNLGIYQNQVAPNGVLTASPNGANVLYASPDGNIMLYSAAANSFTVSRKDVTTLSGAFAASNYG